MSKVKKLFSYIGGKQWLEDDLRRLLKQQWKDEDCYCEPFVGGLGAFLSVYDILLDKKVEKVFLNDINATLIHCYKLIQNKPQELIEQLIQLENDFIKCYPEKAFLLRSKDIKKEKELLEEPKNFFLEKRQAFNQEQDLDKKALLFIFLQRHSFNGVYRENLKGECNSPFNYGLVKINENELRERVNVLSQILNSFDIKWHDNSFEKVIDLTKDKKCFYYLDPPYFNDVKSQSNENKYNKNAFNLQQQENLIELLNHRNFLYSNHNKAEIVQLFDKHVDNYVVLDILKRKNFISAKSSTRQNMIEELIVGIV